MNRRLAHGSSVSALALFVAFAVPASACLAQSAPFSSPDAIRSDLALAPCDNKVRLEAVKALFLRAGATEADLSIVRPKKTDNLVVQIPGREPGKIIFGAHYDKASSGCGAIDNWSGVVIIAHIYAALRSASPAKTFIFAAFGKEEKGLIGSRDMANAIPKDQRKDYCAMVNIDSFGLGAPQTLESASSSKVEKLVRSLAKETGMTYASDSGPGSSDSASFKDKHIPAVTLEGLTNEYSTVLHSPKDTFQKVNLGSVWFGYRLALLLAQRLDSCDCAQFR